MLEIVFNAVACKFALDIFIASACAVALGVAALNHKVLNDSVEGKTVIELLANKLLEVFNGNRSKLVVFLPVYSNAESEVEVVGAIVASLFCAAFEEDEVLLPQPVNARHDSARASAIIRLKNFVTVLVIKIILSKIRSYYFNTNL